MKKLYILTILGLAGGLYAHGQGAIDAYSLSQPDMKGTARFMSMGGAFGALGGDLSSISQNPAGIGVYRSNDVGFTLDLDIQNSNSQADGMKYNLNQTKFLLNNIGAVFTLRLPSKTFPNVNFGFTYNKAASFNRIVGGNIMNLQNSMSNYIAGIANANELTEGDVVSTPDYDPYNPGYNDYAAPWLAILGYDSYLITPELDPKTGMTNWYGQWADSRSGNPTIGSGNFYMNEKGSVNEFNIAFGGNISDVLYWGMNFDIINLNYSLSSIWGENLENALVPDASSTLVRNTAEWSLHNAYSVSGTGFNYQLGFILKPVQEFRLGFAFHTPTWYSLNENFGASVNYLYGGSEKGFATTNDGLLGYNQFGLRTPWKIIASAAGVIGSNFILSFDYEWANYGTMHLSEPSYYSGYDYGYDWWPYSGGPVASNFIDPNDPYAYENADIANYYKSSNTFRVGLEFKPTNRFSIRAGYAHVSSPVKKEAKNNLETIYTAGTNPSYRFDNNTNYVTCGLGYRLNQFYADLAYVYKHMGSEYHAYTPDIENRNIPSPQSKLNYVNNQVVLTLGYRF